MPASANFYCDLERAFGEAGARIAVEIENGPMLSYADVAGEVARWAAALSALGVRPGDRVSAQVEKSISNVFLYLATLKAGAVYNPLNTAYTAAELEYFISDAEPALVVVGAEKRARIEPVATRAGARLMTLEADGSGTLAEAARAAPAGDETVPRVASDLAALLYTSGTTGRSKGAMITHGNLASNAAVLSDTWGFRRQGSDVLLHALPIFHVHGLFVALHTAMLSASRILWLDRFDLDAMIRLLPRASVLMGVPTFYTRLLADPRFTRATCSGLRLAISGSAPLLAETHAEFRERTGLEILERYGMTEAGMITSNPYAGGERIAGTVGYALPGVDVRVADREGRVLGSGEVGVLEVKGPNVFKGYWRNEEKTREEFRADGYFITGDLATKAADGRVAIVGRAKDLIISGGFNVYPKEIEDELNALPGVKELAVVGVPHADFGEGVVAVLTMQPGVAAPAEADVIARLKERLARFKLPKRVFVVDDLPRNAMGKVQKAELRSRYAKSLAG